MVDRTWKENAADAKARRDCIRIIENHIGWEVACSEDPVRPTQVSHIDLHTTLRHIVEAIRETIPDT